jgi:endonuclease-3 related protein
MPTSDTLRQIFDKLFARFGPQRWWPARTPWEVIVGAVLTQNTAWRNAKRAIVNLEANAALEPAAMNALSVEQLSELIRSSGTYRVKAARLKQFVDHLFNHHEGDLYRMFERPLRELRAELLSIRGIGRETADAILLYACAYPSFVVDAYTVRVLRRHRLIDDNADYDAVKDLLESHLPAEVPLFNEFHALFVEVGKRYCRPHALCDECPLHDMPHDAEL